MFAFAIATCRLGVFVGHFAKIFIFYLRVICNLWFVLLSTACSTSVETNQLVSLLVLKVIMCKTFESSASLFFEKLFVLNTQEEINTFHKDL